jgi:hypothetical protein
MNDEQLPTTERLAHALEAANDPALAPMIALARAGHYDDFKSDLATPIVQLVNDLERAGHPELAQRAKDGEFDGTIEEGQAWFESEGKDLLSHGKISQRRN